MKKSLLLLAALMISAAAFSQKTLVVNSETIFKAIPAYNSAVKELDQIADENQKKIDNAYKNVEYLYDKYQVQKAYLSASDRQTRENEIITAENNVKKSQETIFGNDGEMAKKREEKIKPIQDKVMAAIKKYAETNSYDMVLDAASNPSLLYMKPGLDKSQEIIKIVNAQ